MYSTSAEEHIAHLRSLFERLAQYGLKINREKCSLGVEELDFLGHHSTKEGFHLLEDRVKVIRPCPLLKTVEELSRFLGLFNFYQKFVPHVAETLIPLHKLLCNVTSSHQVLLWTENAINAFEKCKNKLTSSALLAYPIMHGKLPLVCDATEKAIGSCLNQFDPETQTWQSQAYYSKALSSSRQTIEKYWPCFCLCAISVIFCLAEMSL